ncbi:hypothetical protein VTL71DRAFT_4960, partial [Oculimacula yallundae]
MYKDSAQNESTKQFSQQNSQLKNNKGASNPRRILGDTALLNTIPKYHPAYQRASGLIETCQSLRQAISQAYRPIYPRFPGSTRLDYLTRAQYRLTVSAVRTRLRSALFR